MSWKQGQSGNPKGRAQEKPFRDALVIAIKEAGADHKALRRIAKKLLTKAMEGDLQAIKEVADRLDGKSVQQVDSNISDQRYVVRMSAPCSSMEEWQARYAPKKHTVIN